MIKKVFLIMAGCIALGLGVIGIMLPLLPTTPLLLLAAGCFIKSSTRLYKWLIHHKTLGPYVYNYLELRAISKKHENYRHIIYVVIPYYHHNFYE